MSLKTINETWLVTTNCHKTWGEEMKPKKEQKMSGRYLRPHRKEQTPTEIRLGNHNTATSSGAHCNRPSHPMGNIPSRDTQPTGHFKVSPFHFYIGEGKPFPHLNLKCLRIRTKHITRKLSSVLDHAIHTLWV